MRLKRGKRKKKRRYNIIFLPESQKNREQDKGEERIWSYEKEL